MSERVSLFLDLYGNVSIRSRSKDYLDEASVEVSRLITDHPKGTSVLRDAPTEKKEVEQTEDPFADLSSDDDEDPNVRGPFIDFSHLKYEERDRVEGCVNMWHSKYAFDIEANRDQRLRHHFKERYDHGRNLCDWDYQYGIRGFTKVIEVR